MKQIHTMSHYYGVMYISVGKNGRQYKHIAMTTFGYIWGQEVTSNQPTNQSINQSINQSVNITGPYAQPAH